MCSTSYRFHTGAAQHFFCSRCGIYTHHQRRSNQNSYAVTLARLDGVSRLIFRGARYPRRQSHQRHRAPDAPRAGMLALHSGLTPADLDQKSRPQAANGIHLARKSGRRRPKPKSPVCRAPLRVRAHFDKDGKPPAR